MSAYLCPLFNEPQVDANGNPLSGGQVFTYVAGSTTPAPTYTTSAGTVPQTNPIILNSRGVPASPIWLAAGQSYKFVLQDANGVTLAPTFDGVQGINDPSATTTQSQWAPLSVSPTFLSATTFSVPGDQTATLQPGRRLQTTNSGGSIYSTITAAVFTTVTTVTVINDSGSLDAGLSAVSYGLLSASNPAIPQIKLPLPNNRVINGACLVAQYGSKALNNVSPLYGGCDRIGIAITSTTASGTLQQGTPAVSGMGTYGKVQSATMTTTGSTAITWFTRLEGKHVRDMGGQSVIFACKVYQNTGGALLYTPAILKANAADNFTGTTTLLTGPTTSVPSGVATTVFMQGTIVAGDSANGLQPTVNVTAFGAVTSKQFDISDIYFGVGATVLEYQMMPVDISTETLKCQRYYWAPSSIAAGLQFSTTGAIFSYPAPVPMRAVPTFAQLVGNAILAVGGSTTSIAGTWTASTIGVAGLVASFVRTAGTWTVGDAILANDAAGTTPNFSLSAEL